MGLGNGHMDDEDESSLLAELAALEGKPVAAKKAKPKKGISSIYIYLHLYKLIRCELQT